MLVNQLPDIIRLLYAVKRLLGLLLNIPSTSFMEIVMALKPNVSDELKQAKLEVAIARAEFFASLKANPKLAAEWRRNRERQLSQSNIGSSL